MCTNKLPKTLMNMEEADCENEQQYEEALRKLFSLPSKPQETPLLQTPETFAAVGAYLERSGLFLTELDSLHVIHVSGTKGKGTTCAYVESILRHAELKTGFNSSPHLVSVRERIRINGEILSKKKFCRYFFQIYANFEKSRKFETDMPIFFVFITCMAYYVFFHEKVDVAIIEVGTGGKYCPTNIVRRPIVTGITPIAVEHVRMLGNTIEEIAFRKAGIMKENAIVYTVPGQPPKVLEILRQYAEQVQAPLFVVPDLEAYDSTFNLGIDDGKVSQINASLALQLANTFLATMYPENLVKNGITEGVHPRGSVFRLSRCHVQGLENCSWPGRFQILPVTNNITYHLDGAHTGESLEAALNWFLNATDDACYRVLIFLVTGERNAEKLIQPFVRKKNKIQLVLFSPLVVSRNFRSPKPDNWCKVEPEEADIVKCHNLASVWKSSSDSQAITFKCINDIISHINEMKQNNIKVLITGSLRLVGTYLSILDPVFNGI